MRTYKAFTLVELLIVIAVIAILAALLFPVFARAREKARTASCLSNCRQIGMSILAYTQDYDEMYCPYFSSVTHVNGENVFGGSNQYWPQLVSAYIQPIKGTGYQGQALITDLPPVFVCPDTRPDRAAQQGCGGQGKISAYGISDDIVNWQEPDGILPSYTPVSLAAIVAPTHTLLLSESFDWLCHGKEPGAALLLSFFDNPNATQPFPQFNGATATIAGRHSASTHKSADNGKNEAPDPRSLNNTVFCDGHAKGIRTADLTTKADYWSINDNGQWP